MNGTTEADPSRVRAWASEQLGISGEPTPETARTRYSKNSIVPITTLPNRGFKPSWYSTHPFRHSRISPMRSTTKYTWPICERVSLRSTNSPRLFGKAYRNNVGCWHQLRGRYSDLPNLVERLNRLEPGLDVVIGQTALVYESADRSLLTLAKTLHDNIVEWFPLAPAQRAAQRRNWLAGIQRN